MLGSCGTRKNTKTSRFYHALNTRYNIYFNAKEAFDEALRSQQDGYKENYSGTICMYPVSGLPRNKRETGGPFDRTIEKSDKAIRLHAIKAKPPKKPGWRNDPKRRAWQERAEYNPFLKNCWLIMGQAQFYNTDFLQASETFSYLVRHYAHDKEVVAEARLWKARCYSEMGWFYEAEDILDKMNKSGIPAGSQELYAAVNADYLVKNKRFAEAIPYLRTALRAEPDRRQRIRMKYLLGQIYADQGFPELAYKTFGEVVAANPPYELEFAARIRQTEVFPDMSHSKVVKRLERMGKDPKNKEYMDQVHCALGNVYLSREDTLNAIRSYQRGIGMSVRDGRDKAICQVKLGDIYLKRREYVRAQPCFYGALAGLGKDYKDYGRVAELSAVLDELVVHVEAVRRQDSLQALAQMPEAMRLAVIDPIFSDDPPDRAYYLRQLPFEREDIDASNIIIVDGLYHMALIYKDKLEDIPLSIAAFEELERRFPGNAHALESCYQVYLMALRIRDMTLATEYKGRLLRSFPTSDYAVAIADPDYELNIRTMDKAQDSIYQVTYERYLAGDTSAVRLNCHIMSKKYPLAPLMPKFMFLEALSYVQTGNTERFKNALITLLEKYPDADVSGLAAEMLKGVLGGRALARGEVKGMSWNLRLGTGEDGLLPAEDSTRAFKPERNTPYEMLLVYPAGSLDRNQLLFTVASYHFSNFMVKAFDLSFRESGPFSMLVIKGFANFDEMIRYYRRVYEKEGYGVAISKAVTLIPISGDNVEIWMRGKTLDEYIAFFDETFGRELPGLSARWEARMESATQGNPVEEEANGQDVIKEETGNRPVLQPSTKSHDLSLEEIRKIRERQTVEEVGRKKKDRKAKLKARMKLRKEKERAYKKTLKRDLPH